jgi:hypothetical protein
VTEPRTSRFAEAAANAMKSGALDVLIKAFVSNNREVIQRFAEYESKRVNAAAAVTTWTTRRDAMAARARARAGLVNYKSSLDNMLPASLTNVCVVYDDDVADGGDGDGEWDENETKQLLFNSDADSAIANPPEGKRVYSR